MFKRYGFAVVVALALVAVSAGSVFAQGPTISSTAELAGEVTGLMDTLVPYWQWILLGGIVLTAGFGLIRRGVRFLR